MKLSIIVPVFNEAKTVSEIIRHIESVNFPFSYEIVAVNDGSTDGTLEKLEKIRSVKMRIISYEKNKGKGFAVRSGIKESRGEIVIIQDADLEYNPEEIPMLVKPIIEGKAEVVYGSRFMGKTTSISKSHYFGNIALTKATNLLFGGRLTDMETCYKAMKKRAFSRIRLKQNRFGIEPEITAKILKKGVSILELPISYHARSKKDGKKIKITDGIKSLLLLLKYRLSD